MIRGYSGIKSMLESDDIIFQINAPDIFTGAADSTNYHHEHVYDWLNKYQAHQTSHMSYYPAYLGDWGLQAVHAWYHAIDFAEPDPFQRIPGIYFWDLWRLKGLVTEGDLEGYALIAMEEDGWESPWSGPESLIDDESDELSNPEDDDYINDIDMDSHSE
jgi:hypothetical protein